MGVARFCAEPSNRQRGWRAFAETLEHSDFEPEREEVLNYLARNDDGRIIMIDSLKLAPLIYDSGLPLNRFLYNEGDRSLWKEALQNPARHAGWICVLTGDEISGRLNVDPHWADGYALVSQTKNLSLFRLKPKDR